MSKQTDTAPFGAPWTLWFGLFLGGYYLLFTGDFVVPVIVGLVMGYKVLQVVALRMEYEEIHRPDP